ncbi:MAG: UDP-glucose 4-epimerase GalE [Clostridia bacterium]|jgi:UDP-glucose 4-epimerase|nr:UDP-glucose 4-epimerase GalE [Clostridia bacterium]
MSILVTGGAGYIGSHTVRALQRQNRTVAVYDNLVKGHRQAVAGAPLIIGDLQETDKLETVLKEYGIDCVVHFAAHSLVGESMTQPRKYYDNNVIGTMKLLDTLVKNNIGKIVFSSTAAVYGEPEEVPITEEARKNPTNVYGRTKLMIEQILADYDAAYGLKYMTLRYFNACGADQDGTIGEDHRPESHLIPLVLAAALGMRENIQVFGADYPTPDGTCIRDYIHVDDLAEAHILALDALQGGAASQVYNLGNGSGFSVREVIETAQRVTGREIKVAEAPRREGDPAVLIASSAKIKKDLGWGPKKPGLEEIIASAWKWHGQNPHGFGE